MNYNYAICVPRINKQVYNWTMSLEEIDRLFTSKSRDEVLSWLKQNDSVLEETDASKLQIMKKVSNSKYVSERYTYVITNPRFLNFDISPFLLSDIKLVRKLHSLLIPYQKRNVSPIFKKIIPLLENNVNLFVQYFQYLPYEEKRVIWTILSEEESVAKILNQGDVIETLDSSIVVLKRKAS